MLLPIAGVALMMAQAAVSAPAPTAVQQPVAASPTAAALSVTSPAPASGDKVVCHSIAETGTRFSHRVCHNQSEWDALTRESQDATASYQQKANQLAH